MNSAITSLILFGIVLIGISYLFRSKTDRDDEEFLISSRSLSFFESALTIAASKIGAGLLITTSVLAFSFGYSAIFLFIGFVFGYIIFFFFARRLYWASEKGKYYTFADYFSARYGSNATRLVGFVASLTMIGWVITNLVAGGKIVSNLTSLDFGLSIVIIGIIIICYVLIAGFSAVVKTDIVQMIAMALIFVAFYFVLTDSGVTAAQSVEPVEGLPVGRIIIFLLVGGLFPLGSAELWERVYATKTLADVKKALITSSVIYILFGFLLVAICLKIRNIGVIGDVDTALITGLQSMSPEPFHFLISLAFAAAILSSADTFSYSTSSLFVKNVLNQDEKKLGERVKLIRITSIGVVILGCILAYIFGDVLDVTLFFVSLTIGLAIVTIFTWAWQNISQGGIVGGLVLMLVGVMIYSTLFGISELLPAVALVSTPIGIIIGHFLGKRLLPT